MFNDPTNEQHTTGIVDDTKDSSPIERLITRFLDGELRADERQKLHRLLREDAAARAMFDEMVALDRAAGDALRVAAGRAIERAKEGTARGTVTHLEFDTARRAVAHAELDTARSALAHGGRSRRVLPAMATAAAASIVWWLAAPALQPKSNSLRSGERPSHATAMGGNGAASAANSWFAPIRQMSEYFSPVPPEYERPQVRINQTQRDWLLIPRGVPGEYFLIEVDLTKTQVVKLQSDF